MPVEPTEPPEQYFESNLPEHLNLPVWGADDRLLRDLALAAHEHIANVIGAPIPDPIPRPLAQAKSMLVAHWYENREAASPESIRSVPFGFDELVQSYRRWVV